MSRFLKRRWKAGVLLFLAMGGAYLGIDALVRSEKFRLWAEAEAGRRLDFKIVIGQLKLQGLGISVQNLRVAQPSGLVLFECRRCDVGLDPLLPFTRKIRSVKLSNPVLRISSQEPAKPFSLPRLSFGRIEIEGGEVIFFGADSRPISVHLPDVRMRNLKLTEGERIELSVRLPWLETNALIKTKIRMESPYIQEGEIQFVEGALSGLKGLLGESEIPLEGKLKARVTIATARQRGFQARLNAEVNGLASPDIFSAVDGWLDLDASFEDGELRFELKLTAPGLPQKIKAVPLDLPSGPFKVAASGSSRLAEKRLHLSKIAVETPAGSASGSGDWKFSSGSHLRLNFDLRKISLFPLQKFAGTWVPNIRRDAIANGTAEISSAGNSFSITTRLSSENPFLGPTGIPLFVRFEGGRPAKGSFSVSRLEARLGEAAKEVDHRSAEPGARVLMALLDQRQIQALRDIIPALQDLKRTYPGIATSRIESGSLFFQFPDGPDGLTIHGAIELKGIDARPLKVGLLRMTVGDLTMRHGEGNKGDLTLNLPGLTLNRIAWSSAQGFSAVAQELQAAAVVRRKNADVETEGTFHISGAGFSSPDGRQAGEHLALDGNFSFSRDNDTRNIQAKIEARVKALELLVGKFFADLKGQDATLTMDGSYKSDQDSFDLKRLETRIPSLGRLSVHGELSRIRGGARKVRVEVNAPEIDADRAFRLFVQETFKESYPFLARMTVQGKGSFSSELEASSGGVFAQGELKLHDLTFGSKSGIWSLSPFNLALPFKVGSRTQESGSTVIPRGRLSIGGGRWGESRIAPFLAVPYLWNNRFGFQGAVKTSLFDGTIQLSDIRGENIFKFSDGFSFSGNLEKIDLRSLSAALGWPLLPGKITARIPVVHWSGEKVGTDGELTISVFGGTLRISKVELEAPLSPVPSLKMNALIEGIDLSQASEALAFGKVSGILEGSIQDLVISGGQPSRFTADIHTLPRRGVSQRIDVEALNKLSILGSGGGLGALNSGIYRMFQHYRYQKIGFKGRLENDRLILRGIERRDGKEYLVVGTLLPPTVNVVSHTQEVSFNELMRRIERVKSAEASKKTEEKR